MSATYTEKQRNRRLRTSYFSVVISMTLVLFVVGCIGLSLIMAKQITNYLKEQFTVVVFFNKNTPKDSISNFISEFKNNPKIRFVKYIDKETAAKNYSEVLGEDFLKTIGENPLLNSVELNLKGDYISPSSITDFADKISRLNTVDDVLYPKEELRMVYRNTQRIGFWLLVVSGFFLFIAIILINNTIRLGIYAKRFTIKTMQLVGATRAFVRKPFLIRGVLMGFLSGLLSCIGLGLLIYSAHINYPIDYQKYLVDLLTLAGAVIGLGIFISCICTYLATQRFLKLRTRDLY